MCRRLFRFEESKYNWFYVCLERDSLKCTNKPAKSVYLLHIQTFVWWKEFIIFNIKTHVSDFISDGYRSGYMHSVQFSSVLQEYSRCIAENCYNRLLCNQSISLCTIMHKYNLFTVQYLRTRIIMYFDYKYINIQIYTGVLSTGSIEMRLADDE